MAQGTSSDELQQCRTSNAGLEFTNTWSFTATEWMQMRNDCPRGSRLNTTKKTSSFDFMGNKLNLNWYLKIYPNGFSNKEREDGLMAVLVLDEMPECELFTVERLTIKHNTTIKEMVYIDESNTSIFDQYPNGHMSWYVIDEKHNLTNDTLGKYKIDEKGISFDITIKIQKIEFRYNNNNYYKHTNMIEQQSIHQTLLQKLDRMQESIHKMALDISSIKNSDDMKENNNYTDNNDNNNNRILANNSIVKSELEEFISNIFNNNKQLCGEYINLFIKQEGFEDIDTFCELTQNDLKELGINKLAHRKKIMKKIEQYNGTKMDNNNIVTADNGGAFDGEGLSTQ